MTTYNYSSMNLLEYPQKYQMSPFEGKDFILAYLNSRKKIIELLQKNKKKSFLEILEKIKRFPENDLENLPDVINLEKFLSLLLYNLLEEKQIDMTDKYINLFLKKFEIKKKLYSFYNSDFKEINNNFKNIHNYVLLTIIFQIKYKKLKSLKYLNTILKLNDVICSQYNNLKEIDEELTFHLLSNEIDFVKELCYKKGIDV